MALLNQLGAGAILIDLGFPPHIGVYSGILVLGATLKAVTRRFEFLRREEKRLGVKWTGLGMYLLGSERPLDPKLEMPEHVPAILQETGASFFPLWREEAEQNKWPRTETEMMERVIQWLGTGISWRRRPVSAPNVKNPNGSSRPANTAETIQRWLLENPSCMPGKYLLVSSQPFCEGQKMAVERAVRKTGVEGYTFDVCGPAAPPLPLSRWLDNLAKQLWEEVQLLPK
jgi:hypothetical protein